MRCFRASLAVVLFALSACGPVTPAGKSASTKSPKPATSAPAVAAASPQATATPAPKPAPALLAKPAGNVKVLAGSVRIDATYAVTAGATLISNNGGTAIGASGSLITNNSGNIISQNGGNLISDTGGSLISDHGAGYRLAQAGNGTAQAPASGTAAVPAAPKQGEQLPAAGLVVAVRDMVTGERLSLGVTGQGKPVYEVLTNAAGGFELFVPATDHALVLESRFPAATGKAADPRLQYDLLAAASAGPLVIDEDTAQVSRYARNTWQSTIEKFVLTNNPDGTVRDLHDSDNPLAPQVDAFVIEFHAEAVKVGLDKAPAAAIHALSSRIADTLIARVPLAEITLSKAIWPSWTGPEEPAIAALIDVLRRCREATNAKLATDPAFFPAQPYMIPPYEIKKSTDLAEFLMEEYLAKNKHHRETDAVLASIGVEQYQSDRLYAAVNNYIGAVTLVLLTDPEAKAKAYELIRSYKPN